MLGLGQGMEEISSLGPKKRPKGSEASHQPSQQEGEGPYCHRPGEEGGEGWGVVGGGEWAWGGREERGGEEGRRGEGRGREETYPCNHSFAECFCIVFLC